MRQGQRNTNYKFINYIMYSSVQRSGLQAQRKRQSLRQIGRQGPAIMYTAHSTESSLREKLIEHVFVGELLRCLWLRGVRQVEVLRSEVDRGGYDIVLECNGICRHIQLKASHRDAKTSRVDVNLNLASKSSGCVIWIWFDPATLSLGPFLWFGDKPGQRLPELGDHVGRHTRGDQSGQKHERTNIRVLAKGQFTRLESVTDIATRLFGESATPESGVFPDCNAGE